MNYNKPIYSYIGYEMFSDALQRAMDWIVSNQSSLGGWSGPWTDRDWSGAWTTAGVIYSWSRMGRKPNDWRIIRAADWLLEQQNEDGGWARVFDDFSSAESTAWVVMALTKLHPNSSALVKGIKWILENQREDGGWDYHNTSESDSRVVPTCFAILSLLETENAPLEIINKAVKWLESKQLDDGSWTSYQTMNHSECMNTALALLCLSNPKLINKRRDKKIKAGANWLISNQAEDGSWPVGTERVFIRTFSSTSLQEKPLQSFMDVYLEWFSTPWVLLALVSAKMGIASLPVQTGISYLLESQDTGGGWAIHIGGRPIFFATYQTICCLCSIEQAIDLQRDYAVFASRLKAKDELIRQLGSDAVLAEVHQALMNELPISKPIIIGKKRGLYVSRRVGVGLLFVSVIQFALILSLIIAPSVGYSILLYLNQQHLKITVSLLSLFEGTLILVYLRKAYKMPDDNFYVGLFGLILAIIFYMLA